MSKVHKSRLILKETIGHMQKKGRLNFEYTFPGGEQDVTKKVFDTLFGSEIDAKNIAMIQTVGCCFGQYLTGKLLKDYHNIGCHVHIQEKLKEASQSFEGHNLSVTVKEHIDLSNLNHGDLILVKPQELRSLMEQPDAMLINSKQITVMVSVDEIPQNEATNSANVKEYLQTSLGSLARDLTQIDSFILKLRLIYLLDVSRQCTKIIFYLSIVLINTFIYLRK